MLTSFKNNLLVLDCSITMAWCFEDEITPFTEQILDKLDKHAALVPAIWPMEVANVLLHAEKQKRISHIRITSFQELLNNLHVNIDETTFIRARTTLLELARETNLTIYDAAYLELAITTNLPLATLDKSLKKAAKQMGTKLYEDLGL